MMISRSSTIGNKKPGGLLAAWLFCFFVLASFSGVFAAGFEEVNSAYQKKFLNAKEGTYEIEGYLIVVVERPAKGRSRDAMEASNMLATKPLLNTYVLKNFYPKDAKPRENTLLQKIPNLKKFIAGFSPAYFEPRLKFANVESFQLENKYHLKRKIYRYSLALDRKGLKKSLPKTLPPGPGIKETIDFLRQVLGNLEFSGEEVGTILNFRLQVGALEEALDLSGKRLAAEYPLASFPARPVEDLAAFYTNLAEAHRLLEGKPSAKAIAPALEKAPALPQAFDQLAALCRKEDRHLQAANIHLMRLTGSSNLKDGWAKVLEDVRTQAKASNTKAHQQYLKLLTEFSTIPMSGVYGAKEDARGILRGAWRTFGHLNFPDAWSAEQPQGYQKAMELFAARGDVNQMIVHLKRAVLKSPRHAPSWNLLGRCLMIQKKYLQALPALNQAARLHNDAMPRTNVALCYKALKYHELAQGMALAALLAPKNTNWTREQANRIIGQ